MQLRSRARHFDQRPPRVRRAVVAVVAALAVVVAVPALAIALGNHQRPDHRTQASGADVRPDKADRAAATPRPSRGHVPPPAAQPVPEPTAETTPDPAATTTVEPTPEAAGSAQAAPSAAPQRSEAAAPAAPAARATEGGAQIEAAILAVSNAQRAANGLGALSVSSCATDQAKARVAQLVAENGFYHPPMDPVVAACKAGAGENLAIGYQDGSGVVDGWMNSPGHRENLLRQEFTSMGVSCQQQNGRWLCGAVYLM